MTALKSHFGKLLGLLLLVILVIFFGPFWVAPSREMKAKSAMKQAYQIHQALFAYAQTHDGNFPALTSDGREFDTANHAFRELFRAGLVDDERLFYVQDSAWHRSDWNEKIKPDGNIGTEKTGFHQALARNENHFAYVSGLNANSSPAATPLVMDGFCPSSNLGWSKDCYDKGGVWMGLYAIVIRVSGAAKVHELDAESRVMEPIDGKLQNISKLIDKVPGAFALNPDG
jgi:hypothetical protein